MAVDDRVCGKKTGTMHIVSVVIGGGVVRNTFTHAMKQRTAADKVQMWSDNAEHQFCPLTMMSQDVGIITRFSLQTAVRTSAPYITKYQAASELALSETGGTSPAGNHFDDGIATAGLKAPWKPQKWRRTSLNDRRNRRPTTVDFCLSIKKKLKHF
jgi:hypothetical protein